MVRRKGRSKREWSIIQAVHVLPLRLLRLIISEWLRNNKINRNDERLIRHAIEENNFSHSTLPRQSQLPFRHSKHGSDRPGIENYSAEWKQIRNDNHFVSTMIFNVCLCHFGCRDEEIAYERRKQWEKKITGRRVMNAEEKSQPAQIERQSQGLGSDSKKSVRSGRDKKRRSKSHRQIIAIIDATTSLGISFSWLFVIPLEWNLCLRFSRRPRVGCPLQTTFPPV